MFAAFFAAFFSPSLRLLLIVLLSSLLLAACSTLDKTRSETMATRHEAPVFAQDCTQVVSVVGSLHDTLDDPDRERLQIAYTCLQTGDFDITRAQVKPLMQRTDYRHTDYAHYLHLLADYKQWQQVFEASASNTPQHANTIRQIFAQFREFARQFSDSHYRDAVIPYLMDLHEALARTELSIAHQYFENNEYSIALARAGYVAEHFAHTQSRPYALALQFKIYTQLEQAIEADRLRQTLQVHYPQHPVLDFLH